MRAVIYCHAYPGSGFMAGGETTLHDMNRALVDAGWEVRVVMSERFTNGSTHDYIIDGVQVLAFRDKRQLLNEARQADLLISHLGGALRTTLVGRRMKKPVVQLIHNDIDLTKGHAGYATMLVYNTHWVKESFIRTGHHKDRHVVVRPPVEPDRYRTETTREYITLVNLSDGRDPKGNPGRYDKGARMMYHLARQFPQEKFLGVKGAYGTQYIEEGHSNVTLMDNTEDAKDFYSRTKLVISPSNYESYGRISVEAACSGIPAITSTAPGFEEHAVAKHRLPFDDEKAWEEALREVLENYHSYATSAEVRAQELWWQTQNELKEFVEQCEQVAHQYRGRR